MKHIIIFEKLIDGKIKLQKKIYNILQIIDHEVSINDTIIKCRWKNNKVYVVFNNKNYKIVQVKICTFTNKNPITVELISALNIPQMVQLFEK